MTHHLVYFTRWFTPAEPVHSRATMELRYSLRSVAANLDLGEVHIFGGIPAWLSDAAAAHPVRQGNVKHENTWKIWQRIADACRHKELPEQFLIMNDDFFAVQRVGHVPAMTRGTMGQWIAERSTPTSMGAREVMVRTKQVLDLLGPHAGLCYEVHAPLVVDRDRFAAVMGELAPLVAEHGRIAKRTAWGNLAGYSEMQDVPDPKVRDVEDPHPPGPWWSTSDEVFMSARRGVGRLIREWFSVPCAFER